VILTVRDPQQWYRSFVELTAGTGAPDSANAGPAMTMYTMKPVLDLIARSHFGTELQPGRPVDKDVAIEAFERHIGRVRADVPPDRLLVFDVRDGWEPLCTFLGVPTPADVSFPHLNDSRFLREARTRAADEGRMPSPFQAG
jgi:hypothetical protein